MTTRTMRFPEKIEEVIGKQVKATGRSFNEIVVDILLEKLLGDSGSMAKLVEQIIDELNKNYSQKHFPVDVTYQVFCFIARGQLLLDCYKAAVKEKGRYFVHKAIGRLIKKYLNAKVVRRVNLRKHEKLEVKGTELQSYSHLISSCDIA